MSNLQPRVPRYADEIIRRLMHDSAADKAKEYVDNFATTLILQAKVLAFREKAELVLTRHIDEAVEFILLQKKRDWLKEFLKIIGGALIGAFVPGIITSLPTNDMLSTVIFIALGFAGMLMVFIGLSI